jgi:DNA polymerase III gamma/tau subunit
MSADSLLVKYRPTRFEDVVGQDATVRSLKGVLGKNSAHAFLFTGPSGTGKTTLARIAAKQLGCTETEEVREVDAATYTGIDAMRELTATLNYKPRRKASGAEGKLALIVDEAHALSAQAWKALLKSVEEPPPWIYWFFCTTEPGKVPATIRTRCLAYALKPVSSNDLYDLLDKVAEKEGILKGEIGGKIIDLCAKEAGGSPRQALANLAACAEAKTRAEAVELLHSAEDSPEAFELAQLLDKGKAPWTQVRDLLLGLTETNPESVRQVVRAYMTKAALGAESEKAWGHRLEVLDAFSKPFNSGDGITPVILAAARVLFGG